MKARLPYIVGFLLLLGVEICIGVFYFSKFIRAYIGDVIVVWVIYCLLRSFVPKRFNSYAVAMGILAFSFMVEFLQKAHIADILGIENQLLRIIIGTDFAVADLWSYAAGTLVTIIEIFIYRRLTERNRHGIQKD